MAARDHALLLLLVVGAEERGRIADALLGGLVLLNEAFEDAQVATDLGLDRMRDEIPDLGLLILAVAVDAPVCAAGTS